MNTHAIGWIGLFVAIVIFMILFFRMIKGMSAKEERKRRQYEALHPETRQPVLDAPTKQWGPVNPAMICPHCQTKGSVRTKMVTRKDGISGGKATAALLTAGASLFVAGLSKKNDITQAHCDNCKNTWAI